MSVLDTCISTSYYCVSVYQSLAQLLCEMREVNKSLQFEVDDLKQKLKDSNGDIKVFQSYSFTSHSTR